MKTTITKSITATQTTCDCCGKPGVVICEICGKDLCVDCVTTVEIHEDYIQDICKDCNEIGEKYLPKIKELQEALKELEESWKILGRAKYSYKYSLSAVK